MPSPGEASRRLRVHTDKSLDVDPGTAEEELKAQALAHPSVAAHVGGRAPRRVVVVPGRLLDIAL